MFGDEAFISRFPFFHDAGVITFKTSSRGSGRGGERVTKSPRNINVDPESTVV